MTAGANMNKHIYCTEATKDKTLVRKWDANTYAAALAAVGAAKPSEALWEYTSVTDCQWDLYPIDTHDYIGSHSVTSGGTGPAPAPAPSLGPTAIAAPTTSVSIGQDLFISEMAEGSSSNKYLEIYNPTAQTISLDGYYFGSVANARAKPSGAKHRVYKSSSWCE